MTNNWHLYSFTLHRPTLQCESGRPSVRSSLMCVIVCLCCRPVHTRLPISPQSEMSAMIYRELFNEMPYGAALTDNNLPIRCSNCFLVGTSIPCSEDGCKRVGYCTDQCRDADQSNHTFECLAFKKIGPETNINQFVRLLGRILTRRMVDNGIVHLCENFPENIPDRNLSDLMSHQKEIQSHEFRAQAMTKTLQAFQDAFSGTLLVDDFELVKRMYCIMWINCFSVSGPIDMRCGHGPSLGLGFYLNVSRFNHSCKPDLLVFFDGARLIMQYPSTIADETAASEERLALIRSPKKFSQLTISYGFAGGFSNECYFPLRSQRRSSLQFGYYFKCECVMCSDELAASMEEHAAAIECINCGKPYVWKEIMRTRRMNCFSPTSKKIKYTCVKTCQCISHRNEIKMVKTYVKTCEADNELKQLEKEWKIATASRIRDLNPDQIIDQCESVWEKARSYWHRTANLRMTHLHERLFAAYNHKIMNEWRETGSFDRSMLKMAVETGEATVEWFQKDGRLLCDTVVVALSYEMARLYELAAEYSTSASEAADAWSRCSLWLEFGASIWRSYGNYAIGFVEELTTGAIKATEIAAAMEKAPADLI